MSNVANKYKVGIFVVATILTLIIIAILLGSFHIFKTSIECMTVVNSSVQGLSNGAKVKYNGVTIGQVSEIKISPNGNYVYIYMSLAPETIVSSDNRDKSAIFIEFIKNEIKNGLCCQLRYEGITGILYQEIKFFPPEIPRIPMPELPAIHPLCIPSTPPVLLGDIITKINNSLEKLSKIDEIFIRVIQTVDTVNKYLEGPQLNSFIQETSKISKNIGDMSQRFNETLTKDKLEHITKNLYEILDEIKKFSIKLNRELDGSKLPETMADARKVMNNTNEKLENVTDSIKASAESLTELTDTLNKKPDSIIWGKDYKEVVPTR